VKVLARELASKARLLARFKREAEVIRDVNHLNIVKFVDAFEWSDKIHYRLVLASTIVGLMTCQNRM